VLELTSEGGKLLQYARRILFPEGCVYRRFAVVALKEHNRRRAEGAVGFIISEGTGVDRPASLNDPNVPRFHGEKELAAWRRGDAILVSN
jgi:hypothetical protein